MNDFVQAQLLKLNATQQLKKLRMLNTATASMVLSEPENLTKRLEAAVEISKMFSSPFEAPDESVDAQIRFALTEDNIPVGINPEELHALIIGAPGTGKTVMLLYTIGLQAMMQGIKCWYFVKARDVERILLLNRGVVVDDFDGQIKKNLMSSPSNYSKAGWRAFLWDIFIQAHGLYDGTKNFMLKESSDLDAVYEKLNAEPSFFELYEYIRTRNFPKYSRDARYSESALNRIGGMMLNSSLKYCLDCSKGYLEDLVTNNVIFNIKYLPKEDQVFVVNVLIAWLFCYKEANKIPETHFIIIDDAMIIFDSSYDKRPDLGVSVITTLLTEIRKPRIKVIGACQIPSLISKGILGTSALKAMFSIPSSEEINCVLNVMGVYEKEKREYSHRLDKTKQEMLVKLSDRYIEPFIGYAPDNPIATVLESFEITSDMKKRNNARMIEQFGKVIPRKPYDKKIMLTPRKCSQKSSDTGRNGKDIEVKSGKPSKTDRTKDVLLDIYNRFDIASSQRAVDLELSAEASNRIYKYIEKEQLAETIYLNFTGKRGGLSKYHLLTDKGVEVINKPPINKYSGGTSPKHIFLQRYLKKHLPSRGFKEIGIEKEFCGKRIDLFCKYKELKIAIEICISTIRTEYLNVQKDFSKCDHLIIVCPDKKTKNKLEKEIYKKISPHRKIKICLVHELLNKPDELICDLQTTGGFND